MAECWYTSRRRVRPAEWTFDLIFTGTGIGDGTYNNNDFAPVGSYPNGFTGYHDSATAGESMAERLRLAIDAAAPAGHSFTCTFSPTTGLFTLHCTTLGAGNWSLNFDQEEFGDWFGWQGAGGGFLNKTTAQSSTQVAAGLIYSGTGRTDWHEDGYETTSEQTISESGVCAGLGTGYERTVTSWRHEHERYGAVVSPYESGTWDQSGRSWCWKDFFLYHQRTHQPFRLYTSTALALSAYKGPYVLTGESLRGFQLVETERHSHYYWPVPLTVRKYLAAT